MTMTASKQAKPIDLHPSWLAQIGGEFNQPYMHSLKAFLKQVQHQGQRIFPKGSDYFAALNHTPFDQVKVVILGQDPYHGPGQAHGLCFSVPPGVRPPPSLVNIYKELQQDVGLTRPEHGTLTGWAQQGVLLLNSVLTVTQGQPASHQGKGWECFTDAVIQCINQQLQGIVVLLWGSSAQRKGQFLDDSRHKILKAPHPSPLSASRGFFGCKHFSQTNAYLQQQGKAPINWQL